MVRPQNKIESDYIKRKDELIRHLLDENGKLKRVIGYHKSSLAQKTAQIRHFRLKLLKTRNSIDYLLKHPYGMGNSYRTEPHERDSHGMPRLSQTYHSKKQWKGRRNKNV